MLAVGYYVTTFKLACVSSYSVYGFPVNVVSVSVAHIATKAAWLCNKLSCRYAALFSVKNSVYYARSNHLLKTIV